MIEVILKSNRTSTNSNPAEEAQLYTVDGMYWRVLNRPRRWRPPTDVYELDDTLVVRVEIAGMKEADFSISLTNRWLSITGARSESSERRAYHQMEIPFGEFAVELEVPFAIDENRIEAYYQDGFLKVLLPRERSHQIKIEGK
jgi:HSP20 family molecular chaperone IbpA